MEAAFASRAYRVLSYTFSLLVLLINPLGVSAGTDKPIHQISSEVCQNCHKEIYKQWKGSMHAQSTALKDPIHGTFYKKVVGSPTEEGVKHKASGKYPICLQCHAPNAAVDKTTKLDAKPA
ncbi:MAG: cytochrome c family protein, partial [Candidatus Thiodiazotropha sp. (ex Lucinoma annulata)]|nr:cytochrome c family protein [Candidatus Thiodiazotropha sp. (ex Lucinoma annulata)]